MSSQPGASSRPSAPTSKASDPTTLLVDVAGMPIEATPLIEVRDEDLRLVGRFPAGIDIPVYAGPHVVRLVRPDGSNDTSIVTCAPGARTHVLLGQRDVRAGRDDVDTAVLRVTS